MSMLSKSIAVITNINRWIAYVALVLMMIMTGVTALLRGLGHPVIGDMEIVQMGMVIVIVGAVAFTEATNSHISIGIIVDHFPNKIQKSLDIIAYVLTIVFAFTVPYAFLTRFDFNLHSMLLRVPLYPLKVLLILGFASWGLVAIEKLIHTIKEFNKPAQ